MKHRFLIVASLALAACAKHVPPPKPPPPPPPEESVAPPPPKPDKPDEMVVTGVLGSLADDEIAQAFQNRWSDVTRCLRETPPRVNYLIGRVELKVRIGPDGAPKNAHVQDSSLGHYGAEHCLLELAQSLRFPSPHGGPEAEFSYPIEYKPVRTAWAVTEWPKERAATPDKLALNLRSIQACRRSLDGKALPPPPPPGHKKKHHNAEPAQLGPPRPMPTHLRMTLYVGPGGKVVTAGLSADGPVDTNVASCLVSSASLWKLDDPGGRPAKVTLEVSP
jgi:TonB family protein